MTRKLGTCRNCVHWVFRPGKAVCFKFGGDAYEDLEGDFAVAGVTVDGKAVPFECGPDFGCVHFMRSNADGR